MFLYLQRYIATSGRPNFRVLYFIVRFVIEVRHWDQRFFTLGTHWGDFELLSSTVLISEVISTLTSYMKVSLVYRIIKILAISKFPAIQNKSLSWFFLNIKGGLHRNILNKQLEGERCDPNVPPTVEENEVYFSITLYANKRIYDWVKFFTDKSVALQSFFATTALHSDGFEVFVLSVS